MAEYRFKVYSFHPKQYKAQFYRLFDEEMKKGNLGYMVKVEETAPPPELIKDIVVVTASSLAILKVLYDFYKEIRKKKGSVIIKVNNKKIALEAHGIDEVKALIELESKDGN